jgi:peptidyl-prolyl cis-trans isomerase SurA
MATLRSLVLALITLTLSFSTLEALAETTQTGSSSEKFQSLDRMVAIVNNDTITGSELEYQTSLLLLRLKQNENELPPMAEFKKQILERMIIENIQLQIASESGIDIDEATLNQTLEEIASRDGMPLSQMSEFIEEQGIPFTYFRETVKKELILSRLQQREIGQHISVSKTDVEHFLNSPQGQDKTGYEYRIGHILIALPNTPSPEEIESAKKEAEELKKQLRSGASFKTLAMSKSAGPQALNGGDLGWKKGTELPSLFAKQVLSMGVNEIYGPIRNTSGFHLIKLLEKRNENGNNTKDAMRGKAMDILYQRKFEDQLTSWLRRIREDAEVKIYAAN